MTGKYKNSFVKNKSLLTGVAAAALLSIGALGSAALQPTTAYADAVKVIAPQMPSFADVVENVSPAVVSVQVETDGRDNRRLNKRRGGGSQFDELPRDHPLRKFFDKRSGRDDGQRARKRPHGISQGSGFFISEDGYLVTNNHVVKGGNKFTIVDNNGEKLEARLIGTDPKTDLAVLKVDDKRKFTYVAFHEGEARTGEWVVAVGNPFGLGGTVTAGIVSARGRDIGAGPYDDFLQIDAAVNKGNSGGPTFSLDGQVVGVNTAIYSPSGGNVGIAFAVPAKIAKEVTDDLIKNGAVVRGWLGVQIQPVTKDIAEAMGLKKSRGAIVVESAADGPAAKAGLKAGDVILQVSEKKIKGPKKLAAVIAAHNPDENVEITILRDGEEKTIAVKLGTLPGTPTLASLKSDDLDNTGQMASLDQLGITVEKHDGKLVIVDVDPDGNAAEKGIRRGMVIGGVNGEKANSVSDVEKLTTAAIKDGRQAVLFQIEGQRGKRFVAIPVDGLDDNNKG